MGTVPLFWRKDTALSEGNLATFTSTFEVSSMHVTVGCTQWVGIITAHIVQMRKLRLKALTRQATLPPTWV